MEVVDYFGEDAMQCDTTKIFSVLEEFRIAMIASKQVAAKKVHKSVSSIGSTTHNSSKTNRK